MTVTTEPTPKKVKPDLPAPLVHFGSHPLRWIKNHVIMLLDSIILGHVGLWIIAGLYFLVLENHWVKPWWDRNVTPASLRHNIRDLGEGTLAAIGVGMITWNAFKRSHKKTGRLFAELKDRLHLPTILAALVSAAVLWAATFALGQWLFHVWSVHTPVHAIDGSLGKRIVTSFWKSAWNEKLLGFVCTFVARRPLRVIFDETQGYFAGRRAQLDKPTHWYHPPVFVARVHYLHDNAHEQRRYSGVVNVIMPVALFAAFCLAGYGFYVLTYVA